VLLHVAFGAEDALLFARPQADADGAARLDVERLEDAHHFHRDDGARAVVGGAGAGDPAIEMAADHDDLVLELGIGAGNFGDGVEAVLVVAGELGFDIDFDRHRDMRLGEPVEAAVALDGGDGDGNLDRLCGNVRSATEVAPLSSKKYRRSRRRSCTRRGWAR
jgi:hypothetical protein